jgi:5-methylcytosine-specific restriction enzyme A
MENTNLFAFKKVVDLSLLTDGITLPYAFRDIIYVQLPIMQKRGTSQIVHIIIDNVIYDVNLNNVGFNKKKNPTHGDVLQFRYTGVSKIALEFQRIFHKSYEYILDHRVPRKHILLPDNLKEYLVFYFTSQPDTFFADCILTEDIQDEHNAIQQYDEMQVEEYLNYYATDPNSSYANRLVNSKIRKYNRNIGETLKNLYHNQCQICCNNFKDRYGEALSEIHHIDYYVKSLNNDSNNLLVICPNHHRIIHKVNPIFKKKQMIFTYPNGLVEEVKLKGHLISYL